MLLLHFTATVFMAGVIWFGPSVHYPLLARLPEGDFVAFEREHMNRTGWIVGPPMLIEAGGAAALLLALWLATAIFSGPRHHRLSRQADTAAVRRLVATNGIRTFGWTARAVGAGPAVKITCVPSPAGIASPSFSTQCTSHGQ